MANLYWLVRRGGLGWAKAPTPPTPERPSDMPQEPEIPVPAAYNALQTHSGLFLSFVESASSPQAVADFFRHFAEAEWGLRSRWPARTELLEILGGPELSLDDWAQQAAEMKRLVDLWSMLRAFNHDPLHNHIHWRKTDSGLEVVYDPRAYVKPKGQRRDAADQVEVIASSTVRPEWFGFFPPNDAILPAVAFLQSKINERLAGKVHLRLLYDVEERHLRLNPVPEDLITALWLQFAEAVANDRNYRQCQECGAWFEISPEVARTNRRFCADACRLRMYRQRQGRARAMHAEGCTVEAIAAKLDSQVETVRGWLAKAERRSAQEPSPPDSPQG
jgi:hypothetical protein